MEEPYDLFPDRQPRDPRDGKETLRGEAYMVEDGSITPVVEAGDSL